MPITKTSYPTQRRSEVETAHHAASAFFNLAGTYFGKLPKDINEAAKYNHAHMPELIAASTNLALSVELSLKAIAMATGTEIKRTHDLYELFDALRPDIQNSIELVYNEAIKQVPDGQSAALVIYITTTPHPPTDEQRKAAQAEYPKERDLRSVLKSQKDAFVNWRYFYEKGKPGAVECYRMEHARLCVLKNVINHHYWPGSGLKQPKAGGAF